MKRTKTSTSAQVETKSTEQGINVKIASSRPPTILGKQGDHVSAYALFKRCVIAAVENADIDDAPKLILQIIDSYTGTEDSQKYFDEFDENLEEDLFFNLTELTTVINALEGNNEVPTELVEKVATSIIISNTQHLEKILSKLIETHLTLRNKLALTAFPTEGNVEPTKGEGNRVKKAVKTLKDIKEVNDKNINDVIDSVKDLFWYPKIPEDTIINLDSEDGRNRWDKVKKNYRSGVEPRNNDISTLGKVIANHVELVFSCFKGLQGRYQDNIVSKFIDKVNAEWSLSAIENKQVIETVKQESPDYLRDLISDESHSTSYTSTETSRSDSPTTDSEEALSQDSDGNYKPGDSQRGFFKKVQEEMTDETTDYLIGSAIEKIKKLDVNDGQDADENKDEKLNP